MLIIKGGQTNMGELSPGSVGRRYVPDEGEQKLRGRIHKESKYIDNYGKLPYSFSKPPRIKKQRMYVCCECGNVLQAPINTIMVVCSNCGKAAKVKELGNG